MRISRRRFYAHPQLIHFIEELGLNVHQNKLGVILVGDLSQPRGGPSLTGHMSHQTGLDADIWFSQPKEPSANLTLYERESVSALSVLGREKNELNAETWTPREKKILQMAAQNEGVDRIFVTPWVKRDLCSSVKGKAWLGKLRPWWGHDDHFHVRLKCPQGSQKCVTQAPVSAGDGCDASLDWWFSKEAALEAQKMKSTPSSGALPQLPLECSELLDSVQ
jgi:penicillin-insensitive murein endopeptidase